MLAILSLGCAPSSIHFQEPDDPAETGDTGPHEVVDVVALDLVDGPTLTEVLAWFCGGPGEGTTDCMLFATLPSPAELAIDLEVVVDVSVELETAVLEVDLGVARNLVVDVVGSEGTLVGRDVASAIRHVDVVHALEQVAAGRAVDPLDLDYSASGTAVVDDVVVDLELVEGTWTIR